MTGIRNRIIATLAGALVLSCSPNTRKTPTSSEPLTAADLQTPAALSLSKVTPDNGNTNGTTVLTITGTGFQKGAAVSVGDQACDSVVVWGPKTITCAAKEYYGGPADVTVSNPDGAFIASSAAFTYSGAPTFNFLSKEIFSPICASCHPGMLLYSGVALRTTPGDPDGSALIVELGPGFTNPMGQMPLGGSLTATQLQGIRDWIQAGSKND